ncbi:MAG: hypothetical protein RJA09_1718 [Pseudomonadota bacterium]|jgi:ketosteroid isomerase-like protein
MRKRPAPYASVEDVEMAFYEALQRGDTDALMACWADEEEIACVHPGGARLVGAEAIRGAFQSLFAAGHGVAVRPEQVRQVQVGSCCVHHVVERIDILTDDGVQAAHVVATNVYSHTAQGWRLVVHHASPGAPAAAVVVPLASPSVLH